jgi:hypothetical protein
LWHVRATARRSGTEGSERGVLAKFANNASSASTGAVLDRFD